MAARARRRRSSRSGRPLQAVKNDLSHLDRFLARGDVAPVPVDSRLAADLTRPRDLVLRASVERRLGGWTPGIECTWTRMAQLDPLRRDERGRRGRLGLFNSRGGRPCNGGGGPGYHSTSLFGSRRVPLPGTGRSGRRTYANLSLHAENLLNERNVAVVGSVAGSPLFGLPLVALPGRSVRLSVSFDR